MPHLRFGDCEIDLPRRELRVAGRPQALPPKAYATLLLLIEQRHRVVSREELLRTVWGREALSPSVPGRTVMLVRRAIGDSATQPRWIQSLHGVGYRFIGDVQQSGACPPAPRTSLAGDAPARLAVLPCENLTGEAALAWAEVGLMALVGRALAGEPAVDLVAPTQLMGTLAQGDPDSVPAERAWHVMDLLGATAVLHGRLGRQGPALWLDFRLFRRGSDSVSGSLRGDDVVALADRLAALLLPALRAGAPARTAAAPSDPFIAQAWARAAELHGQGDHAAALPLLDVVCRHDPGDTEAALLRLHCLVHRRPAEAPAQAQALLADAERADDARLRARTLAVLATSPGGSDQHASALAAAAPFAGEDWAIELALEAARHELARGEMAAARRRLVTLEQGCARLRRVALGAQVDERLAALDLAAGELADAHERLERAAASERRLHRRHGLAQAQALLACVQAAQGRLDPACSQADEVLETARHGGLPDEVLVQLLPVYRERLQGDRLRQVLALLGPGDRPGVLAARACLALAQARPREARRLLRRAFESDAAVAPLPFAVAWLLTWLRLEAACGQPAALACVQRHAVSATPFGQHPLLIAASLHADATLAWRHGDLARARTALEQMVVTLPAGREQALAAMDLAWCALEAGDAGRAERLVAGLGPWLRQHPVGLATQARLLHGMGCHAEAAATQARAVTLHAGTLPPVQGALRGHYADCAAGRAVGPRPVPPVLPSDGWLPLPGDEGA